MPPQIQPPFDHTEIPRNAPRILDEQLSGSILIPPRWIPCTFTETKVFHVPPFLPLSSVLCCFRRRTFNPFEGDTHARVSLLLLLFSSPLADSMERITNGTSVLPDCARTTAKSTVVSSFEYNEFERAASLFASPSFDEQNDRGSLCSLCPT